MDMPKIVVTGASGMLGRAVFRLLDSSFRVQGWAHSRLNEGKLTKVDLTNRNETKENLESFAV